MNPQQRAQLRAKIEEKKKPPLPLLTPQQAAAGAGIIGKAITELAMKNPPDAPKPEKKAKKKPKYHESSRLPDLSVFDVIFEADKQEWRGQLRIATGLDSNLVFSNSSSGVFRLLMKLDRMYREYLEKAKEAEVKAE